MAPIMAITWERTMLSEVSFTIFHTLLVRLPQNPACSQMERSSRTVMPVP